MVHGMNTDEKRIVALCNHFGVPTDSVSENRDGTYDVDGEPGCYRVWTDDEADSAADEALESYLDDCLLAKLPPIAAQYFDREAWKRDALLSDGRAHFIATYDGDEHEEQVDGEWFFIYRDS